MAVPHVTSRPPSPPAPAGPLDVEQAEAALVEHYPRLVRLAYLILPTTLGRHRRALGAHALVQRTLPRRPVPAEDVPLPAPRDSPTAHNSAAVGADPAYVWLRAQVVRRALSGERPRRFGPWEVRPLPPHSGLFPRVVGLRLFPRSGGTDELALVQALSQVSGAARAVVALRGLEGLPDRDIRVLLHAAGVPEPERAIAEGSAVPCPAGSRDRPLLASPEFDPCRLQARPTDLMRRRQHTRAALAATAAVLVCGVLIGPPGLTGGSWGPDGAAAPRYARNAAAESALDPGELTRVPAAAWKTASRSDFSVWPARGGLTRDTDLLRRALAVWARPGSDVAVGATRGTSTAPPAGPPQLLYAGRAGGSDVVLLHDGLRVARYAEPHGATGGSAALDLARTDLADTASAAALVLSRDGSNVRYLTAPWITAAASADLLDPDDGGTPLRRDADGVTDALAGSGNDPRDCSRQTGLLLTSQSRARPYLYTDLGELTPVRLTAGSPQAAPASDALGGTARGRLAREICHLRAMAGSGVKAVNLWEFARQRLPENGGTAAWLCTRGETWRGTGARVQTSVQPPAREPRTPGALAVRTDGTPACGPRGTDVLSGVLWKSRADHWYVLAAGSERVRSVRATGGVTGSAEGRTLAVRAEAGARAGVTARLSDGTELRPLR
ncbi:hypothetical protein HCC30_23525 [Streptomyces sp. HNM0574]|nr:hypothetical protein [Streptomyces sp. HNM0574]